MFVGDFHAGRPGGSSWDLTFDVAVSPDRRLEASGIFSPVLSVLGVLAEVLFYR